MKPLVLTLNFITLFLCILTGYVLAQPDAVNGKYIREWLVLGPFFPDDLEKDFLSGVGGEANINPGEGDIVTATDGKTLRWEKYKSEVDIIDLVKAIGHYDDATAYAFCLLQSDVPVDAQIHLGSDDGVALWINGKKAHRNPVIRTSPQVIHTLFRSHDVFDVALKAGDNRCLIKVFHRLSKWRFAMNVYRLPQNRAIISGIVTDPTGKPISDALVRLEQNDLEIANTYTDVKGSYQINVYPAHGRYDLSVTKDEHGTWQLGIGLKAGERRRLNLLLKPAISIEGTILMLDNMTPHTAVPVQAIRDGKVVATTLSNDGGKYRFINLKPGRYQVRCQIPGGYVYYGRMTDNEGRTTRDERSSLVVGVAFGDAPRASLKNIDFRIAPVKKGIWKSYNYFVDGLRNNAVTAIHRDPDGVM